MCLQPHIQSLWWWYYRPGLACGLYSKSLSLENAGTPDTSTRNVPDKRILLDTNLDRFLTSTLASTEVMVYIKTQN
jgi:hypothetical protein